MSVVITGAFSYTGKYATRLLLNRGHRIRTLTFHTERTNPFGDAVQVFPYNFDHPDRLTETLRGASTLIEIGDRRDVFLLFCSGCVSGCAREWRDLCWVALFS